MAIFIRRRKTETATITHEFLRIRRPQIAASAWCNECGAETKLVPPDDAAMVAGVNAREIYRRVEIGHIHFAEFSDGSLLVCLNSILP
jgi:hypothetical protein